MQPINGILLASSAGLGALYGLRRYAFRWGTRAGDLAHPWPGDEVCPESTSVATRVIAIDAPARIVWAYVAQVGQDRAGFYSYRWLENLFRCAMPKVDEIVPEWQGRTPGENVWLAQPDRYHGAARVKVAGLGEGAYMVLTSPEDWGRVVRREHAIGGSWTFIVVPDGADRCRLVVRSRGPAGASVGAIGTLWRALVFDPAHFIMERRMLRRIKQLAERSASCSYATSCPGPS